MNTSLLNKDIVVYFFHTSEKNLNKDINESFDMKCKSENISYLYIELDIYFWSDRCHLDVEL